MKKTKQKLSATWEILSTASCVGMVEDLNPAAVLFNRLNQMVAL